MANRMNEQTIIEEGVKFSIEVVTPEAAAAWLDNTNTLNRKFKTRNVDVLVRDMKSGAWSFTGQPISFDLNGVLIDGQHRLEAVRRSKIPQKFLIVTNMNPRIRDVTDTGSRRSFADMLRMSGYTNTPLVSAIVALQCRTERSGSPVVGAPESSVDEMLNCLNNNTEIVEAARFVSQSSASRNLGYISNFGWIRFKTYKSDQEKSDRFFSLLDGEEIPEPNCVTRLLHKQLLKAMLDKKHHIKKGIHLSLLAKAWRVFSCGRHIKLLKIHEGEDFQVIS